MSRQRSPRPHPTTARTPAPPTHRRPPAATRGAAGPQPTTAEPRRPGGQRPEAASPAGGTRPVETGSPTRSRAPEPARKTPKLSRSAEPDRNQGPHIAPTATAPATTAARATGPGDNGRGPPQSWSPCMGPTIAGRSGSVGASPLRRRLGIGRWRRQPDHEQDLRPRPGRPGAGTDQGSGRHHRPRRR